MIHMYHLYIFSFENFYKTWVEQVCARCSIRETRIIVLARSLSSSVKFIFFPFKNSRLWFIGIIYLFFNLSMRQHWDRTSLCYVSYSWSRNHRSSFSQAVQNLFQKLAWMIPDIICKSVWYIMKYRRTMVGQVCVMCSTLETRIIALVPTFVSTAFLIIVRIYGYHLLFF